MGNELGGGGEKPLLTLMSGNVFKKI